VIPSNQSPRRLFGVLLLAGSLLVGCGSEEKNSTPVEDQQAVVEEPISGAPDSPPLGAPRAKLSPGELIPEEED
jgi:hypothetical protein